MDSFAAIDFETTGYENGGGNEPWQLGIAVVRGGEVVETREFFFDVEGAPERAHEPDALGTLQSSFETWSPATKSNGTSVTFLPFWALSLASTVS